MAEKKKFFYCLICLAQKDLHRGPDCCVSSLIDKFFCCSQKVQLNEKGAGADPKKHFGVHSLNLFCKLGRFIEIGKYACNNETVQFYKKLVNLLQFKIGLPQREPPFRGSTRVGSGLTRKHQLMLERLEVGQTLQLIRSFRKLWP